MLEKIFKLKQNKTTVRTELIAGLITFLTMSYILVVNPQYIGSDRNGQGRPFHSHRAFERNSHLVYGFLLEPAHCAGTRDGVELLFLPFRW